MISELNREQILAAQMRAVLVRFGISALHNAVPTRELGPTKLISDARQAFRLGFHDRARALLKLAHKEMKCS